MSRTHIRGAALAALVAAACGRDTGQTKDSTATVAVQPAAAVPAGAATPAPAAAGDSAKKPACPGTGRWETCSVEKRLKDAGLVAVRAPDTVRHDFLSVPGARYALGRAELEVFLYPDSAAVARDVAGLDTVRVARQGEAGTWQVRPTFMRSANLLALLASTNERQIERVQLALTAGPPPPEPPKKD